MKKLVVYYSFGGNTKKVAMDIARSLRADVLEINTVKDYPDDYDVLLGLAQQEVKSGYMPRLRPYELSLDRYEAVILGTPVWWSSFAPAMKKFMSGFNWKGRRVYPFATSEDSLGHAPSDFKKALRGAIISPVLGVKFKNNKQETSPEVVEEWVKQIKLDCKGNE